ncbi:MAG: cell wall/surface repeat protein [Chthoniobacteraceae bacterium]|nr:cell wall/surface repeat protein [Chthoniobacteraceae bacterium]
MITISGDGKTWQRAASNTSEALFGITAGNTRVVISTANQDILSSSDLSVWSKSAGPNEPLSDLRFGNGVFVGVGSYGTLWYSTDGLQWSARASGYVGLISRVSFGADRFVAVTSSGEIRVSTDGMSWSREATGLGNAVTLNAIGYGDGRFFAVGNWKAILYSQKLFNMAGFTPSLRLSSPQTAGLFADNEEGGVFDIERSTDLLTWSTVAIDQTAQSSGLLFKESVAGRDARCFYRVRMTDTRPISFFP